VIQHRDRVLHEARLRKPTLQEREEKFKQLVVNNQVAEWSKWRLVLDGKLYKPKFKNMKEWEAHHNPKKND
jgi:hypothetical protein